MFSKEAGRKNPEVVLMDRKNTARKYNWKQEKRHQKKKSSFLSSAKAISSKKSLKYCCKYSSLKKNIGKDLNPKYFTLKSYLGAFWDFNSAILFPFSCLLFLNCNLSPVVPVCQSSYRFGDYSGSWGICARKWSSLQTMKTLRRGRIGPLRYYNCIFLLAKIF